MTTAKCDLRLQSNLVKVICIISSFAVLLVLATFGALTIWKTLDTVNISIHGYIAIGAGALVSITLGVGLMFLVFYSNRRGYDDFYN